jgi:hypothetical protein
MPPRLPVALGLKVMANVQLAPAAIIDGQSFVCAKSAKFTPFILAKTRCGVLLSFVRVTALEALAVLTI